LTRRVATKGFRVRVSFSFPELSWREPGRPGGLLPQGSHRSGRARRRRIRFVTLRVRCPSHNPSAVRSHAWRFGALGMVLASGPQRGAPFAPRGPRGPVPPLRHYYEALRLPTAHPAALRCLRLAVPPLRLGLLPAAETRDRGHRGVDVPVPEPEMPVEAAGSPRFPGHPECPLAVFLDPGRTERARPLQRADVAPACVNDEGSRKGSFRGSIAKPEDWLSTLRSEDHSSPRKTRFRLLGQAWPGGIR
jgi:hypothetical protein